MTVTKVFRKRVERYPNKPCFLFEDRVWTNADVSTKLKERKFFILWKIDSIIKFVVN